MGKPTTMGSTNVSTPKTSFAADDGQEVLDLGAIFAIIWRGRWVIAACVLIGLIVGIWRAYIAATPLYGAEVQLVLDTRDEKVVDIESVVSSLSATDEVIRTEVHILGGRELAGQVVDRLNLISDPEFNMRLRDPGFNPVQALKDMIKRILGMQVYDTTLTPDPAFVREKVIQTLLANTRVVNIPDTYIFSIWVLSENPFKAADIANAFADNYVENQVAVKLNVTEQATGWLAERVTELRSQLEANERRVADIRAQADVTSPAQLIGLENRLISLRSALEERAAEVAEQQALQTELSGLQTVEEQRTAARRNGYGAILAQADNPQDGWRSVLAQLTRDLREAEAKEQAIRRSMADLEITIATQSDALTEVVQAERDAEASRLLFENFQNRLRETSMQIGLQRADSRVISRAFPPDRPALPNKGQILILSVFLGGFLGTVLVVVLQLSRARLHSAAQIAGLTSVPVIAVLDQFSQKIRPEQASALGPQTRDGEAIRNLRTTLLMARGDVPPQVVVFTSAESGDGKSTLSAAMAHNMAQIGKSVLLVDGDLRRHYLSDPLADGNSKPGLFDVLSGRCDLADAVLPGVLGQADILPAGSVSGSAADLLSQGGLTELLSVARSHWDIIIFDTPPISVVPDARIIGQHADLLILLAQWNTTRQAVFIDALRALEQGGRSPNGIVLTKVKAAAKPLYGATKRSRDRYYHG
ncbi:putative exopolysaccharide biosynthesis transport protein (plasmid) [Phaeobacter gallaeciensis]|uniref:non-specific protein-tyrosine kinase n=1 Tax=Phaeobacter gallaeciensis TaxID=60890 RepID=A0AAC9ZCI5_9RHOB|nr:capsular exopolysaccharide family [Phaeobacter gallaeciensis DSM 26640]ATE94705.1 putative exopolysaccharide biosynthesis transport protein [Phaeobacter gallaeciensis]ATE98977.1 putative exopolysaccharide biosynthesis transport protein [Phaeobacter gallaeciensis]ATF03369.1 putative exopolysaccharide biosynthesis transport protein [Phaeobacter gallaeciensis]ATF07749.1 putative exopolysaccharide biosynthesis transport protein [Phaeobacter gallaeciensis]